MQIVSGILPGRPEELEAVDLGSNSFTLKWKPAGSSEMRQEHFKITLETLGRMKENNLNRKVESFISSETFTVSLGKAKVKYSFTINHGIP